jgi:hypothetical protein
VVGIVVGLEGIQYATTTGFDNDQVGLSTKRTDALQYTSLCALIPAATSVGQWFEIVPVTKIGLCLFFASLFVLNALQCIFFSSIYFPARPDPCSWPFAVTTLRSYLMPLRTKPYMSRTYIGWSFLFGRVCVPNDLD